MSELTPTAVVTGGSRGIGRTIALTLAAAGYQIFFTYVSRPEAADAVVAEIEAAGGVESEVSRTAALAEDFRSRIGHLPLKIVPESMSNAVTALHPLNASAYDLFTILKDEYGMWVCPNGGEMAHKVFRVGHIGALTKEDNTTLINALNDLHKRGILK